MPRIDRNDLERQASAIRRHANYTTNDGLSAVPFTYGSATIPMPHISAELQKRVRYIVRSDSMPIAYLLKSGLWILPQFAEGSKARANQDRFKVALRKALNKE